MKRRYALNWPSFFRALAFGLTVTLLFCCVAIVPPWRLPAFWTEIDATERSGLIGMLGFLAAGIVCIALREGRSH